MIKVGCKNGKGFENPSAILEGSKLINRKAGIFNKIMLTMPRRSKLTCHASKFACHLLSVIQLIETSPMKSVSFGIVSKGCKLTCTSLF